ncbi:MAG: hypothetical protein LBM69_00075 [Lachnospiraceae bacterium]|nr:hypothetical protein [Lachnospiraceae bacterium]
MTRDFIQLNPSRVKEIRKSAWSIESRAAHGAAGVSVHYIGSEISGTLDDGMGRLIFDYYKDNTGAYWFKNRALLRSGEIASMEYYIFGHEIRPTYRRAVT